MKVITIVSELLRSNYTIPPIIYTKDTLKEG